MDVSITFEVPLGSIFLFHTFNGATPVQRGWMVCDGNIVNQTNYDAIHGSGCYSRDNVAQSPISGKNLPNFINKFAVGTANTTQDGSSPITSEGLSGHTLSVGSHNHAWYRYTGSALTHDQSYNSSGTLTNLVSDDKFNSGMNHIVSSTNNTDKAPKVGTTSGHPVEDIYTSNAGAFSQSIKPESIAVVYIIKVI